MITGVNADSDQFHVDFKEVCFSSLGSWAWRGGLLGCLFRASGLEVEGLGSPALRAGWRNLDLWLFVPESVKDLNARIPGFQSDAKSFATQGSTYE